MGVALLKRAADEEKEIGYSEPPQYARPALEVLGAAYTRAGKFNEARAALQRFSMHGLTPVLRFMGSRKRGSKRAKRKRLRRLIELS